MKILEVEKLGVDSVLELMNEARSSDGDVSEIVLAILADVKSRGDEAVREYTQKFDNYDGDLIVSKEEIEEAYNQLDPETIQSIKFAKQNIEKFHKANLQRKEVVVETVSGVEVWREFRAIEKVGLYVPGGKAAYPSTVLMLVVPAKIAGCLEVVMCTPSTNGKCNPAVLVAADLCGIDKIFKVGGAQAIAAMAYGTELIPKVYKIFGPGNQFVSAAKMQVYGEVDIDMPAGPSELMIIADKDAKASWVAADFLTQLEHGTDSQSVFLSDSRALISAVETELDKQIKSLSRRAIVEKSLKRSFLIFCDDLDKICEIANEYAPEHLEIISENEKEILERINNVGSVFLGEYSCETFGDYVTGANHTLPTSAFAKMFEALSVDSFGKKVQVQRVSKIGFQSLCDSALNLAKIEGLDAHAKAVSIRINN